MPKLTTVYVCQVCGQTSQKWLGRCAGCGEWNSLVQEVTRSAPSGGAPRLLSGETAPRSLLSIDLSDHPRAVTGVGELDRVLGGGLVPGGLVLVGGDPGIGKSTLLLQVADHLGERHGTVLYATAEESAHQVRLRAERVGARSERVLLLSETDVNVILKHAADLKPSFLVVDSIQTVFDPDLEAAPGSVSQVRHCASRIMREVKAANIPTFLVGHVTKEGAIAGPRVLEHIVDTVLYFEGESRQLYRIIRSVKNRFGSTDEIGIFEMGEKGLTEVSNPSAMLLSERADRAAGSVVFPAMEGSRPLLLEMQALVAPSFLAAPRRNETGVDHNRAGLIFAVLEKRARMRLSNQDIFLNVVGGVKVLEPAADLAIALAVVSSFHGVPINPSAVVVGEIGLSGEVRAVSQIERRLAEARRLGFTRAILPARNLDKLNALAGGASSGRSESADSAMKLISVSSLIEAVDTAFEVEVSDRLLRKEESVRATAK